MTGPENVVTIDQAEAREAVMLSSAAYQSNRLARSLRLEAADRADVEQEVLLVLVERRGYFDPARGPWTPFVHRIANQAAQQIADRQMRSMREGPIPLSNFCDGDEEGGCDAEAMACFADRNAPTSDDLTYCHGLHRFAAGLDEDLALVFSVSLACDGDLGDAQRRSGLARAEFYRRLRELRYRLVVAGLAPRRLVSGR